MDPRQATRNIQKVGRQDLVRKTKSDQAIYIKKEQPQPSPRRSTSLQQTAPKNTNTEPKLPLPSQGSNTPVNEAGERKRKRPQESEGPSGLALSEPLRKQRRTSLAVTNISDQSATRGINDNKTNLIHYWSKEGRWPKEYFDQDGQTRRDFENYNRRLWVTEIGLNHLLLRKRSLPSLSSATPSDQQPREAKSIPYLRSSYETVLATKGSFMGEFDLGITDANKTLCQTLLDAKQSVPQDTLFSDDLFHETCEDLRGRNEAMVLRDISLLICPHPKVLRIYGAEHLKPLNESVNEGWNSAESFYDARPQPDYSVGFGRSAFTDNQLENLKPLVGDVPDTYTSYYMATWRMYFPFLTCEVKCSDTDLDVADRQNAHSMTLVVRATVELFRHVKREKELHREILAFSISHNHEAVRIYGHYPVIDGNKTTFYRHRICKFDFTDLDGKEKWTAYRFIKSVYSIWMPTHLKRICLVIDTLPNFEVSQQSELGESYNLPEPSNQDASSLLEEVDSQSSRVGDVTPETSVSQRIEGGAFKKPKKMGSA